MVSIIVPAYNSSKVISETIESVLNQTYKDFELLIVDDGSKDNTREVIANYTDPRIRAFHDENHGVCHARNHGLIEAKGEYVTFTDNDDILEPTYLEKLVKAIEGVDYSRCNYSKMENGKLYPDPILSKLPEKTTGLEILRKTLTSSENLQGYIWSALFRKSIIDKYNLRLNEKLAFGEDILFTCQYLQHTDKASIVHETLYDYRINAGSTSNKYMKRMQASLIETNKELDIVVKALNDPILNNGFIRVKANDVLICFYNNRNKGNPFNRKTRKQELENMISIREYYEAIKFEIMHPLKGKYWLIRTLHYIYLFLFYSHKRGMK